VKIVLVKLTPGIANTRPASQPPLIFTHFHYLSQKKIFQFEFLTTLVILGALIFIQTKIFIATLRASTAYAFIGRSLVSSCFHVLLVVWYSRINLFIVF
jgi:hypothetical protein